MSPRPLTPRGIPLTDSADFTDAQGVRWLAYIEGLPAVRTHRFLRQTVMPGRQLRLDSASESRVSPRLPAGSPFLGDRRLNALLAEAPLLRETTFPTPEPWPEAWRRRGLTAARRGAAWSQMAVRLTTEAAHAAHIAVEELLLGRRVRS